MQAGPRPATASPANSWTSPRRRVPVKGLARRLYDRLEDHARDLGSLAEFEGLQDIIERGNGGGAPKEVVFEVPVSFNQVVLKIVEATRPDGGSD